MWTLLSLDLDLFSVANKSQSKIENRTANSVDPQETAPDDPPCLDLNCLHRYLLWFYIAERVKYRKNDKC